MTDKKKLTIVPDDVTIVVNEDETLLDAMRAAGLGVRFACRRGGCAFCKVDMHKGSVHYDKPIADTVMSEEEYADGTVLACRALPDEDVTIELRDEKMLVNSSLLLQMRQVKDDE